MIELKWTPCTEGLPKMHDSMFAQLKGTSKWREGMWEKCSDLVLITIQGPKRDKAVVTCFLKDGKWSDVRIGVNYYEVLAWMPFPDPYGEEQTCKPRATTAR